MPKSAETGGVSALYAALRARLARSVAGIVPPREIEDIVQEAYVRVCQVEEQSGIRSPRSYLFRTVRNLALDHVKSASSRLTDSLEDCDEITGYGSARLTDETFQQAATNEEFALFCDAVRHLPVQCRRAFVLKKVYGYTQREIAVELGISDSTVEKHIALGIKRCMHFMKKSDRDHEPSSRGRSRQGADRRA